MSRSLSDSSDQAFYAGIGPHVELLGDNGEPVALYLRDVISAVPEFKVEGTPLTLMFCVPPGPLPPIPTTVACEKLNWPIKVATVPLGCVHVWLLMGLPKS